MSIIETLVNLETLESHLSKLNENFENLNNDKIESLVAGDNITIDNTDPLNPVINSTASGGAVALDDLVDVSIVLPATQGQSLIFDGTNRVNGNPTPAVGSANTLYLDATATIADNLYLNTAPSSFPQTIKSVTADADIGGGVTFLERFVSGPLGRTDIPAGTWTFNTYASTSNNTGTDTIQIRVNKRVEQAGMTGTFTGTGPTRTFTVTGGTPFVAGDAGTNLTATLIETPLQTAWISTYISSSEVIVTLTDVGYVNESGINLNALYYLLFNSGETIDITGTTPVLYEKTSIQPMYTVSPNDRIVTAYFAKATSGTARTISLYYGGTTAYSNIVTPITTDHGALGGLENDDHLQYQTICSIQSVLTNYTFTGSENRNTAYGVDTSGGNVTINIDADLFTTGREIVLCKLTNNTNTVTLDAGVGNNIIGNQTFVLTQYNETITLVKDGANTWKIKATYFPASGLVHTTGNETKDGILTFTSSPIVPTPTTDMQVATKKYVDDNAGGGGITTADAYIANRIFL